jgi:cytochrome c-type biogenesis protein CcmH/NrfG
VSYRDDNAARDERANTLIDEIARLERDKVAAAAADRRLEEARRELATLRLPEPTTASAARAEPAPSLAAHVLAFCAAAGAAFAGYSLLL